MTQTVVLLPGRIKGLGHEVKCEVLARRHFSSYKDCSVICDLDHLPDGEYTVEFDGHSFIAIRHDGIWLSSYAPKLIETT